MPVRSRSVDRTQERLSADEAHGGRHLPEVIRSNRPPLILDGDAHPDVPRPCERRRELGEAFVTLREYLERVLFGRGHDLEDALDVLERDPLVEHVAHAVHEDHPRSAPTERLLEPVLVEDDVLCRVYREPRLLRAPESQADRFRIAVCAARAHLGASRYRIPGGLGPLDRRLCRHRYLSPRTYVRDDAGRHSPARR